MLCWLYLPDAQDVALRRAAAEADVHLHSPLLHTHDLAPGSIVLDVVGQAVDDHLMLVVGLAKLPARECACAACARGHDT